MKKHIRIIVPKNWNYQQVEKYCKEVNEILFAIDAEFVLIPLPPEDAVVITMID